MDTLVASGRRGENGGKVEAASADEGSVGLRWRFWTGAKKEKRKLERRRASQGARRSRTVGAHGNRWFGAGSGGCAGWARRDRARVFRDRSLWWGIGRRRGRRFGSGSWRRRSRRVPCDGRLAREWRGRRRVFFRRVDGRPCRFRRGRFRWRQCRWRCGGGWRAEQRRFRAGEFLQARRRLRIPLGG